MKRVIALIGALFVATAAVAQGTPQYTELNPPQPLVADDANKIEVVEFFWYGCPHCYHIEPLVEKWKKTLPPEAVFRPFPAVFNARWGHDAAIFYTFEALGVLDKVHRPFFDAIHRDGLRTDNQQALAEWLKKQGVDDKRFFDTMKSMGVDTRVRRAMHLTLAYRIDGTPAMAVQGRYTVSAQQGRSQQGMVDTVDYLVAQARKQK